MRFLKNGPACKSRPGIRHSLVIEYLLNFVMLGALNLFFFVFHTAFTLFNLIGWLFPCLRKLHLFTISITAFSWFVLGFWFGWGYCLCTDWHWQVREAMGLYDQSSSYMHFLILKLTNWNANPALVDAGTFIGFLIGLCGSIWVNLVKRRAKS